MITKEFNYKVKGLTKEEVIAEFENLQSWEQLEVLSYLETMTGSVIPSIAQISSSDLSEELERRGFTVN